MHAASTLVLHCLILCLFDFLVEWLIFILCTYYLYRFVKASNPSEELGMMVYLTEVIVWGFFSFFISERTPIPKRQQFLSESSQERLKQQQPQHFTAKVSPKIRVCRFTEHCVCMGSSFNYYGANVICCRVWGQWLVCMYLHWYVVIILHSPAWSLVTQFVPSCKPCTLPCVISKFEIYWEIDFTGSLWQQE